MQAKRELRKEVLQRRDALSAFERASASEAVCVKVMQSTAYCKAKNILCFYPYGSELDTTLLMKQALSDGKQLYLPKVVGDDMVFFQVHDLSDVMKGYKGILEPMGDTDIFEGIKAPETLMIMPGVCFDKTGCRIGYGKGFYDRFLAALRQEGRRNMQTMAVLFSCQLLEEGEIPKEAHDITPDYLVTETECITIRGDI